MNFPLRVPRPASSRHPHCGDFRSPSFRPPCIREATFRHRAAPVFVSLRPSTTVAAWQPGPAAPFRRRASIPPAFVSTGSGATLRRDLSGFASVCRHPCPKNPPTQMFLPIVRRQPVRLRPSPIRITPRRSHLSQTAKRSRHRCKKEGRWD